MRTRHVPHQPEPTLCPPSLSMMYDLAILLQGLPPHCIRKVEATAPRSGQELWDEMVRRWRGTAAEAIAGVDKED